MRTKKWILPVASALILASMLTHAIEEPAYQVTAKGRGGGGTGGVLGGEGERGHAGRSACEVGHDGSGDPDRRPKRLPGAVRITEGRDHGFRA